MTYKEIEKIRYFIGQLNFIQNYKGMKAYVAELKGYFGENLNLTLAVSRLYAENNYGNAECSLDKSKIKNYLERKIDENVNAAEVCVVLDLIDEGMSLEGEPKKMEEYIARVYLSYSSVIKFDNIIKSIATQHGVPDLPRVYIADTTIINSVIAHLKRYVSTLVADKKGNEQMASQQTININTSANANSSTNVSLNIDLAIELARQQAEDAGLSDEQYSQVLKKLEELENIAKSKESKGKRWQKAKEIMMWLVEQGIQVASIVVPVLASSIL